MEEFSDISISYGWLSLMPALLAIGAALLTRQIYVSLFLGVWAGAWVLTGGGLETLPESLLSALDTHILRALAPADGATAHLSIVLFTLLAGGMVGVISANGGMEGVVHHLARCAGTRRRGQGAAFLLGLLLFVDNYANILITGHTMRPLMDRLRVSREKLAFIVNATAAPVVCIAMASSWFAFEVTLIEESLPESFTYIHGFDLMLAAVGYSFYPLLMIAFMFLLIVTGRDFGPMLRAEQAAFSLHRAGEEALPEDRKTSAFNGILPVLTLIGVTFWGLLASGEGEGIRDVLGSADPFRALMWGALCGLLVAIALTGVTRALTFADTMEAMEEGFRPMLHAAIILTLSWALAGIGHELKTAAYVISLLGDDLTPHWLPLAVFALSAVVAFTTGSIWGTLGILMPVVIPLALAALRGGSLEDIASHPMVLTAVASVLSGAAFGGHCSPVAEITVLSSLSSGCRHLSHVVTQTPYALVVAAVSAVICIVPVSFGVPLWLVFALAIPVLFLILRAFGKTVKEE